MSVILSNEDAGACRRTLKIEVPVEAVEAEAARVTGQFRKQARLPGFRKGKVPMSVVEQKFGEEIEREVVERLVPRYWRQAQAESEIEPLAAPQIGDVEYEAGKALVFVADVETRPSIELRNITDFELPEVELEPTAADIASSLEALQREHSEWTVVERAAAHGDTVVGEVTETGEIEEPSQSLTVELGGEHVWEELTLALTGRSAGQSASFTREEGEGEEQRVRAFEVDIAEVKERELPAVDDAFAARVGKFDDVAALEDEIRASLKRAKREERGARREDALFGQLRDRHPLELPQGVVRSEIEGMLRDYAEDLARRGVDIEKAEIDWSQLGDQVRPQAERRVHGRLVLDRIADEWSMRLDESDLEQALAALGRAQGKPAAAVRKALDADGRLEQLRAQLLRRKTVRRLLGENDADDDRAVEDAPDGAETAPPSDNEADQSEDE